MSAEAFTIPEVVGSLDLDVLAAIGREHPNLNANIFWRDDVDMSSHRIFPSLKPFHDIVIDWVTQDKPMPTDIIYSINTYPVHPETAQKFPGWHFDDEPGVSIANKNSTEFLIATREIDPKKLDRIKQAIHLRKFSPDDKDLADMGFEIYTPEPGQAVALGLQHPHRSTTNHSKQVVPRTWGRARASWESRSKAA